VPRLPAAPCIREPLPRALSGGCVMRFGEGSAGALWCGCLPAAPCIPEPLARGALFAKLVSFRSAASGVPEPLAARLGTRVLLQAARLRPAAAWFSVAAPEGASPGELPQPVLDLDRRGAGLSLDRGLLVYLLDA
jgi:hypothetical protein